MLLDLTGEMSRSEVQEAPRPVHRDHFAHANLQPAHDAGLVEMTLPDKPGSSKQRYRLTDFGRRWQAELAARGPDDAERDPE